MNARFLVWWGEQWTKVTLRPGEAREAFSCARTDEGWASEAIRWHYDEDAGIILRAVDSDGVDCDGRLFRSALSVCPVDQLQGHEAMSGERVPAWESVDDRVFDYQAVKAGY